MGTASAGSIIGNVTTQFTGLTPDTYYLTATYDGASTTAPGCASPAIQIVIGDDSDSPTLTLVETAQNTICDPSIATGDADGTITLTIATGDLDGNYDVQWYLGTQGDVSNPINNGDVLNNSNVTITPATSVDGSQESIITGLTEGDYWVSVNDNLTANLGCTLSNGITLTPNFTDVVLDVANVTITDATDCTSPDNGSISIDLSDITGYAGNDMSNYTIDIEGVNSNADDNTYTPGAVDPFVITDLHPDTYRIVITDETSGCISATASATVQTDGITPVLTAAVTDNTNCSGGNGTISITIVDSEGTTRDLSDYDFDWYTGAGTTAANRFVTASTGDNTTSAGGDEQTGLEPGFYTIVATATVSPGNGCFDQIIVEVQDNPDVLRIPESGTDQSTDVTNCSPDNGQIIIDGIRLNGADITDEATLATYSFELFDSDDNSLGAFDNPGSATAGDFPC